MQKYFYFLTLLLLFACKEVQPLKTEKPVHLLSEQKVADILVDLHLAESMIGSSALQSDSVIQKILDQYAAIYTKHEVSEDEFKASLDYYKLKPVLIDSIYAGVIQKLSAMEAELGNYQPAVSGPVLLNADSISNHRNR